MYPFNLASFGEGAEVSTRGGLKPQILCYNAGLLCGKVADKEVVWLRDGSCPENNSFDLYLTGWSTHTSNNWF